ncbi:hypothetical protein U4960_08245 [Altererythrobacter sp. H2]|uniref:hypothetical protein n=1 Tax=Altererythrobacter sp. H2 TaxID=3108391 RepID=UPI002B4BCA9D|nr:hypothetical protein [Altererythrobacter sp. H2]WRK94296.1 hypothetical protein U4960_08245 [Altererythrobacter sp. H2]
MKSFRELAAALLIMLLLGLTPAQAQTITNTARATWSEGGASRAGGSNTVSIPVVQAPISLQTYHPLASSSSSLTVAPSLCNGTPLPILPGDGSSGGAVSVEATQQLRAGEVLIVRFDAAIANRDPAAVDQVSVIITTTRGDREVLSVFETGVNSGVFTGAIRTRSIPPGFQQGDCILSVVNGEPITISVAHDENSAPVSTTVVSVLADPFGFVFDSEDGSLVSGARVSLVDAATGAPAQVFAEDGLTPWPSTVFSGQPITDGSGTVHPMSPGEYRFPLAPFGNYRVIVEPPAPYSAPSVATRAELATLSRPDGSAFVISDSSYGAPFPLLTIEPVRIDIPVDRPGVAVSLSKSASRTRAQPGDAVFYTVTVRNADSQRAKRNITLTDTPSPWLRLRPDSIRIDGADAGNAVTISPDGRQMTFAIPAIAPGASTRLTYAMVVRADAPAGQALNRVEAVDPRGNRSVAEVGVRIDRDTIASRMTVIGRVTAGSCSVTEGRIGIPGVRVMLEDGSFAITDRDGRYHFEGVVPGTHVVQVQRQTLPEGGRFIDCDRSTRSAGSAISRFVIGQGGSLVVADFAAEVPGWAPRAPAGPAETPTQAEAETDAPLDGSSARSNQEAAGSETDWLELGDGPAEFLFPELDHNPRAPSVRVVVRHEVNQKVELTVDGKPVDPVAFEGVKAAKRKTHAVSIWRGVALQEATTRLRAIVRNADGQVHADLSREVAFVSSPWRAELLADRSQLVADGKSRPVAAVRLTDRKGRPIRAGMSGNVSVSEPYQSAAMLDQLQLRQLTGQGSASSSWTVEGDDGVALIELAPTMVSGPLQLGFSFADRDAARIQNIDTWVVPGDLDWTLVGLAEGSVGAKTVADNMERTGRFDSDLGDEARVAFYAKGRILGRFLVTMAYDSAKQRDDQQLLGGIDPNAYYTVFADGSDRRFDAASQEKLYIRIESSTFYALYGDFVTGFDQTILARYQRTATGVKAEGLFGNLHAQAFAAETASRYRRDEIQGSGLTGPYRLNDRNILANSEKIAIEVRDRFRPELIVSRRELTRFLDYDVDLLSGTVTFREPVLSRDFDLNPQFIVIDYEVLDGLGARTWNGGVRADYTFADGSVRLGATALTDRGEGARTELGAIDLRARIGHTTEVRAEMGMSRREGGNATGWLVEAEHRTGSIDLLAYARSVDQDYGTGQQNGAELGRRKIGVDARFAASEQLSFVASAWHDQSLSDAGERQAVQLGAAWRTGNTDARIAVAHFADSRPDGTKGDSTVIEAGVTQRLLGNRLELGASTSVAIDKAEAVDLPARHRLRARYAMTDWLRLVGNYEVADGENLDARTFNGGVELSPWRGSRMLATLGQQDVDELGKRSYAAFGLAQNFQVTSSLTLDATVDGNRALAGADPFDLVNSEHPAASGGHLGESGQLFEDFTAVTLGAGWRKDQWAATIRAEYRDGELADRKGVTFGVIRQLGEGIVVGSGATWTRALSDTAAETEVFDAAMSMAYRPDESPFAALAKLEFRSDRVAGAVAGETGPAGRTALAVTGDAKAQRLIASLSTNWSPRGMDDGEQVRRTEIGLFLGARYNVDKFEGFDLGSTTVLGGLDARIGLGERVEIGGSATVRANLDEGTTSFAIGPQIGFRPAKDTLVTVGYNVTGFRDPDFSAARSTDKGLFASVRVKFDADSFAFLGLGRQ